MRLRKTYLLIAGAGIAAAGLWLGGSDRTIAAETPQAGPPPYDRSTRPDLPSRFTRPDNPQVFDARVKEFRDREISQMKMRGRFTVAVGGDIISTFPIAQLEDPALQAILNIVRGADIGVGNSEANIVDYAKAGCCLGGMMAPKETAADMKAMGFDMVNKASNHIADTGVSILPENLEILREAGIAYAGSGRNLQEARAPGYMSIPKGRAAIVGSYAGVVACHQCAPDSDNSGSDMWPAQFASYQLGFAYGMSGLNPLRVTRYNVVPQADFDMLRGFDTANRAARGQRPAAAGQTLNLNGAWYKVGPEEDRGTASYSIYPDDLMQIERSVRNGKEQSDFLSVLVHAHQSRGPGPREPDHLVAYAHGVIDNGADLFARSGPWELRGIEIYKGRPIFYGLGLMVASHMNTPVGYDRYRDNQQDPFASEFTDTELNWVSWYGPNVIAETDRANIRSMESAVAEAVYQDGKLVEVVVTPMQLGYDRPMSQMGIPRIATGAVAQRILIRIQTMSKALGSNLVIKGDKGTIRIGADGRSL